MSTWISRDRYEFTGLIKVEEVHNPKLQQAYDRHKEELAKRVEAAAGLQGGSSSGTVLDPVDPSVHANETLVFHGCAPEAVESICLNGFQKVYWQSATVRHFSLFYVRVFSCLVRVRVASLLHVFWTGFVAALRARVLLCAASE